MKEVIEYLFSHGDLSKADAKSLFLKMVSGECNNSQIAAILSVFRMRSVSVAELCGFREAALQLAIPLDFSSFAAMDVCGTGGDGKGTFNISTISGIIVAACGVKVTKHGSYAVSSRCGSSNVLEFLGYKFSTDESLLKKQLSETNICFLHAPLFHPSFNKVLPVRKELSFKTIFNMLGPLVNPARPKTQLVGVYNKELLRLYKYVANAENLSMTIVHSLDGCDEVSLTADCFCAWPNEERIYSVKNLGFKNISCQQISEGNSVKESADIFKNILQGHGTEAQNSVVTANAAFALRAYRLSLDKDIAITDCILEASEALKSGKAKACFSKLLEMQ